MDFYAMERLVADHRDELVRDMRRSSARREAAGHIGVTVARALRRLADRLDGGEPKPRRSGSLRVLE